MTHSLMHPSLRRGRWYRLRVAAPRHGMHPCGGGSSSRHCGRRPSPARHTPPRGGGSSSRQRPMQCCSVPRCPASTDTAAGDHRLPATHLLAAVGRRPDNAPCSVARSHAVRRQQTLRPATIACPPHSSLRRWVVAPTTPPAVLPDATLSGVSRRCGRRPSPARRRRPIGPSHRPPSVTTDGHGTPNGDTVTDERRLHAAHLLSAVGRRANDAPYSVTWHRAVRSHTVIDERRTSPVRRTSPGGGGLSCHRRPIQCCPAPRSPAPRSPASADTVTDDRRLPATHLLAAVGRRANDAPYSVTRHRAVRHRAARRQQTL